MSRKENNGGGPNWEAANPWADDPFDDLPLPPLQPARQPLPLAADGFRRDAFGVPEGCRETTQVCQELGVTYRQAHYWMTKGFIPGLAPKGSGEKLYWTEAQVEAARRVREHLAQAKQLQANPGGCGPHCQHEDAQ